MGYSWHRPVTRLERAVAALLLDVLRPRGDVFAWRVDDEPTAARLNAWERAHRGARARTWRVGDWRPAGPRGARRRVTVDEVALHVAGAITLGVYPMHPDGACNSVSADFDDHRGARVIARDPAEDFGALVERLTHGRLPFLAHRSRGGRGYWAHLLPPEGTSAREARFVMHGLLREAGVRDVAQGGTFDGLFPKQDAPATPVPGDATARPGNLFCLPLSRRWLSNDPPGSGFVGVDARDLDAQAAALAGARRVEGARWSELVARFGREASRARVYPSFAPIVRTHRAAPVERDAGAWELALRSAGRLGRPLGGGRYALLCVNDAQHSAPERSVENARGSCVLFPPSEGRPRGLPWCAHAHCARLRERDWITSIGREAWDDACLAARGMHRAGPWLVHAGGITGWYRDAGGAIVPSRREVLCPVPLRVVEERRDARVIEAVVAGKAQRITVPRAEFAGLRWLSSVGVDPEAMLPRAQGRLVEAIERLSERGAVDQMGVQGRAGELMALLPLLDGQPSNETGEACAAGVDAVVSAR